MTIEATVRAVLREWPLYQEHDHVQVHPIGDGWSIMYCAKFTGRPFTAEMHMADPPPSLLSINVTADGTKLYLLFIQVHPGYRGQGYGHQLYERVIELARRLGCKEVRQTPSGGYEDDERLDYLARRGWLVDDPEVYWPVTAD